MSELDRPIQEPRTEGDCPEMNCLFSWEKNCYYWQGGKCTGAIRDFTLITQPFWDKEDTDD